jgi:hypothetical protein
MTTPTFCSASAPRRKLCESPSVSGAETPDQKTANGQLRDSRESRRLRSSSALFTYAEFMIG